jgi:hypothetical protein
MGWKSIQEGKALAKRGGAVTLSAMSRTALGLSLRGTLAAPSKELLQNLPLLEAIGHFLRMPLHRHEERIRGGSFHRLYQPVFGMRGHLQASTQPLDRLVMQTVHPATSLERAS